MGFDSPQRTKPKRPGLLSAEKLYFIMKTQHPVFDICNRLNAILRGKSFEVRAMRGDVFGLFQHVTDGRYKRGYRLELVAKFRTFEACHEFITLNK